MQQARDPLQGPGPETETIRRTLAAVGAVVVAGVVVFTAAAVAVGAAAHAGVRRAAAVRMTGALAEEAGWTL